MFFERYDKDVIESFALRAISKSFKEKYSEYIKPQEVDDFDYISSDCLHALEITLVISDNAQKAYVYEKLYFQGKRGLKQNNIRFARFGENEELRMWEGGSIHEIIEQINRAVERKEIKAKKRLKKKHYSSVDLCLCIVEGGMFEEEDFKDTFVFEETLFDNIFLIVLRIS